MGLAEFQTLYLWNGTSVYLQKYLSCLLLFPLCTPVAQLLPSLPVTEPGLMEQGADLPPAHSVSSQGCNTHRLEVMLRLVSPYQSVLGKEVPFSEFLLKRNFIYFSDLSCPVPCQKINLKCCFLNSIIVNKKWLTVS